MEHKRSSSLGTKLLKIQLKTSPNCDSGCDTIWEGILNVDMKYPNILPFICHFCGFWLAYFVVVTFHWKVFLLHHVIVGWKSSKLATRTYKFSQTSLLLLFLFSFWGEGMRKERYSLTTVELFQRYFFICRFFCVNTLVRFNEFQQVRNFAWLIELTFNLLMFDNQTKMLNLLWQYLFI